MKRSKTIYKTTLVLRRILPVALLAGIYMLATSEEPQTDSINRLTATLKADSIGTLPDIKEAGTAGVTVNDGLGEWKAPMLLPPEEPAEEEEVPDYADIARQMGEFASNYLGARYRLGSTGPKSFDCSGFTSHIYKNFGLLLNRTSRAQYTQGDKVDLAEVKPGDLLFFSGRRVSKNVGHVGMVMSVDPVTGEMEMIHASSSKGITVQKFPDNGYFSRRFIGARRYLGTEGFTDAAPST